MSVNKVILVGNVGKDPEIRYLDENTAVAKLSLATSESYKNKSGERVEQTEWHNIVLWRGLAQIVEKYVKKGSQIYIEGRIRNRSYDDKDGNKRYITEIVADVMKMLGRKSDDSGQQSQNQNSSSSQASPQAPPAAPQAAQTPQATAPPPQQNTPAEGQANAGGASEEDDLPF